MDQNTTLVTDGQGFEPVVTTAAPIVTETAAPIVTETAAPIVTETAAPIVTETAAPIVTETAAPIVTETAAPIVTETAAPIVTETAAPIVTETAAPIVTETAAPIVTEVVIMTDSGNAAIFCPGCKCSHIFTVREGSSVRWNWNGDKVKPTFNPSMLVNNGFPKQCHSFVENGQIRFLSDCFHDLKNQTVDLKPFTSIFDGDEPPTEATRITLPPAASEPTPPPVPAVVDTRTPVQKENDRLIEDHIKHTELAPDKQPGFCE